MSTRRGFVFAAVGFLLGFVEFVAELLDWCGGVDADLLRVKLVERRVVFDLCVAEGLRNGGVVDFAVAVAAVSDEVDDDVGVELVAILGGEGGDADDGGGIFGVDVEDGDGQAFGEVGGEARGVRFFGLGGESDEVVDDDVDAAADGVAVDAGEVQGLGPDALAGEGGVAVDDDGEDAVDTVGANAILAGAGAAHGDGIDGFEVAGVGDEVQGDGAAIARGESAGGSDVVLHVAAAENAAGIDVFEFGEDVGGGFAEGVDHDAEAAAMAHAHDGALGAELGGTVEQLVEEGNEGGDAFEGEALGAEVAGLDDLLEEVGAGEEVEDVGSDRVAALGASRRCWIHSRFCGRGYA